MGVPMVHDLPADLLELKARFDDWRKTRKSSRARTPDELLNAALALRDRYPLRLICRICRLSSKTLNRISTDTPAPKKRKANASFYKLPAFPIPEVPTLPLSPSDSYRIQLERPDGARLTLMIPRVEASILNSLCHDFLRS